MKILEAEDIADSESSSLVEAYTKHFDYLKVLFDEETFIEIFGTDDINGVDMTEIVLVSNMVDSAYMQKINEQKMKEANEMANSTTVKKFNETVDNYEKVKRAKKSK